MPVNNESAITTKRLIIDFLFSVSTAIRWQKPSLYQGPRRSIRSPCVFLSEHVYTGKTCLIQCYRTFARETYEPYLLLVPRASTTPPTTISKPGSRLHDFIIIIFFFHTPLNAPLNYTLGELGERSQQRVLTIFYIRP